MTTDLTDTVILVRVMNAGGFDTFLAVTRHGGNPTRARIGAWCAAHGCKKWNPEEVKLQAINDMTEVLGKAQHVEADLLVE